MTKTTKKPHKNMLLRILKSILYVGVTCGIILLYPVKQYSPDMSERKRVLFYQFLSIDSDNVVALIVSLILISTITISINFIKQQK